MSNRWVNALVKTGIVVVVLHILFLIAGQFAGGKIGWFNLNMIWPHWHNWLDIVIAVVLLIALYFAIYAFWTNKNED